MRTAQDRTRETLPEIGDEPTTDERAAGDTDQVSAVRETGRRTEHVPVMEAGGASAGGPGRAVNQDRFAAWPELGLCVVADGMGGRPAGEIAAAMAVEGIHHKYPGDALPSIDLLHRRQALERALEEAGAGEVTDAGGGGGVMDIYLATEDVRHAMPLVQAGVQRSSFTNDATIEALPADSDDDEAD